VNTSCELTLTCMILRGLLTGLDIVFTCTWITSRRGIITLSLTITLLPINTHCTISHSLITLVASHHTRPVQQLQPHDPFFRSHSYHDQYDSTVLPPTPVTSRAGLFNISDTVVPHRDLARHQANPPNQHHLKEFV
jgi:hypothetical protein